MNMSEESGYIKVRMLISKMFDGHVSGNQMTDCYPGRNIIKYIRKFEVRDMGSGVILIKEPLVELTTGEGLTIMGFGY